MSTQPVRAAERRIGLYIHLAVYVLVNLGLMILNITRTPWNLWFVYPLFGWGLGLLFHGLAVFAFPQLRAARKRMNG